ncbi:hypothetical protein KDX16_30850 [Burkholderia vietnamiensis]|uniref:hypothetical protein n=1 Tax=Burkholderia vietnamiensis TaxID=60552 RepID=UPI001BA26F05|nr:hypothetical protein [Burkholderia vietnamiensis]MBR7920199.1 hypothetical protein [Burkholderia vietnamiensis]
MKITPSKIGIALVVTVGIVAVSASTLITSLSQGSALAIGNMASAVRLVGDATLTSDLNRMTAPDRSLVLSQHGIVSEAALAARMTETREQMNGYAGRQAHLRSMADYSAGVLCASLIALAFISLKVAVLLGGSKPKRKDAVLA